jgi:hypothetical protein
MDAQLQRTATAVCSGSADLGEVLATARRVDPGDYDRWYSEWAALAEKTTQRAGDSLQGGHALSRRGLSCVRPNTGDKPFSSSVTTRKIRACSRAGASIGQPSGLRFPSCLGTPPWQRSRLMVAG